MDQGRDDRLYERASAILDGLGNGLGEPILRHLSLRRHGDAMLDLAARLPDGGRLADPFSQAGLQLKAYRLNPARAAQHAAMSCFNCNDLPGYRMWLRRAAQAGDEDAAAELGRIETRLPHGAARSIHRLRPHRASDGWWRGNRRASRPTRWYPPDPFRPRGEQKVPLSLARDGAELRPASLDRSAIAAVAAMLDHLPPDRPGARLSGIEGLRPLLAAAGTIGSIAASVLGLGCHPVRALLLDKSPAANWALGWHQDRTIAVTARVDMPGFVNWNVKAGLLHVEPPWTVIAGMITLRMHIDAVPAGNAPLLIAPGSHRLGRVPETGIAGAVARLGTAVCLAEAGDVWVYSTPILHASERAIAGGRRRVLQVDYATGALPGGLDWLGV